MGRSSATGLVVAVFGATGHLGRHVVQRLGRRGAEVVAAVRGEPRDVGALRVMADLGKMHIAPFDLRDAAGIAQIVDSADVIVNAMGTDRHTMNFAIADVNAEGARAVARAAAQSRRRPHLVHVGCMRASPDAPSAHSRAKHAGEAGVREVLPSATVVRPATLFGPQDRLLNGIGQFAGRSLGLPVVRGGAAVLFPVHVADVADAVVLVAESRGAPQHAGRTFDLLGPRAYTRRRLAELFAAAAVLPPRIVSLHPRAFWLYGRADLDVLSVSFPHDAVLQMLESDAPGGAAPAVSGAHDSCEPSRESTSLALPAKSGETRLDGLAHRARVLALPGRPGFADLGFRRLRVLEDTLLEVARAYRVRETFSEPLVLPPHLLEDSVPSGGLRASNA